MHFFLGIINQSGQFPLIDLAERIAEDVVDFVANGTRGIAQHMGKGFILPVHVG